LSEAYRIEAVLETPALGERRRMSKHDEQVA
jgi:hypothetical protein